MNEILTCDTFVIHFEKVGCVWADIWHGALVNSHVAVVLAGAFCPHISGGSGGAAAVCLIRRGTAGGSTFWSVGCPVDNQNVTGLTADRQGVALTHKGGQHGWKEQTVLIYLNEDIKKWQ